MDDVQKYAALENRKDELEDELTAVKAQIATLFPAVLDHFQQTNMQRLTIDGRTLYLKRELWAGREEGVDEDVAIAALEGAGLSDFCSLKLKMQSLSAWMRERERSGEQIIPDELRGILRANEKFTIGSRRA